MPDFDRMKIFRDAMETGLTGPLAGLEARCKEEDVPVIRRSAQSVLRVILAAQRPTAVLEVGTAIGFSSVFMCTYSDASVTTIENYARRIPIARETFRNFHMEDRIRLLEGDAQDILPTLGGPYQLIFMDAAKGQYPVFFQDAKRLLSPGGILVTDNILQEGEILDSRFMVERRNRTIHKRMREYLHMLMQDEDLVTTILPVGDGLAISVKKV